MSNYINVLRRLERERRVAPVPPTPLRVDPPPAVRPAPPAELDTTAANVIPVRVAPPPPALPIEPTPAAAPRTVIPMPSPPTAAPADVNIVLPEPTAPSAPAVNPSARRLEKVRSRAMANAAHPGIASLLDNIRLLATGRSVRSVVFAGASTAEAVDTLAADLAYHANTNGMKAIVAALTAHGGRSFVTPVTGFDGDGTPLEVELDTKLSTAALHDWLGRNASHGELLVICAPPLATSIDGALLACACDGLVIVAESEVTERAALQTAAERARITGCRTLGVVMYGIKDRVPGWVRRLVGDSSHPQSTGEN